MCVAGVCTSSSLAPKDTCPFGDDIVTQNRVTYLGITLPSYQSTCQQTFAVLQHKSFSIEGFCNDTYYGSIGLMCCQSCKSEINQYLYDILFIDLFSLLSQKNT